MKGQVRYYLLNVQCEDALVNNFPIINTGVFYSLTHNSILYCCFIFLFASNYVGHWTSILKSCTLMQLGKLTGNEINSNKYILVLHHSFKNIILTRFNSFQGISSRYGNNRKMDEAIPVDWSIDMSVRKDCSACIFRGKHTTHFALLDLEDGGTGTLQNASNYYGSTWITSQMPWIFNTTVENLNSVGSHHISYFCHPCDFPFICPTGPLLLAETVLFLALT